MFALPLVVFELTGSALSLALTAAAEYVPYILFGLLIGAWVDRFGLKRIMILAETAQAAAICSIPVLAYLGSLEVWWIYVVGFFSSTLWVIFNTAEFAALPRLVSAGRLPQANGSLQASYSAATLVGPLLAGAMVTVAPVHAVLLLDAASSLAAVAVLSRVRLSRSGLSGEGRSSSAGLWAGISEGVRHVLSSPVLRSTFAMMALINCVGFTVYAQLVLFAKRELDATDPQVAALYAAGSAGMILLALASGPLRRLVSFSGVALGAPMLGGAAISLLALTSSYPAALALWGAVWGLVILCEVNSSSLTQQVVPERLLGRVRGVTSVMAMSAVPLGVLAGGLAIRLTGDVSAVYLAIGCLVFLVALAFVPTAVGRAGLYLPRDDPDRPG